MANVWFTSDWHFGHKNIGNFRDLPGGEGQNRHRILSEGCKYVSKRDVTFVLGDACFTMETTDSIDLWPGKKILIRGNHDLLNTSVYLKHFEEVYGLFKYKEFWLSHAPIHSDELRGRVNLHGHTHFHCIDDPRYLNCCVENLTKLKGRCLISLNEVRELFNK